MSETTIRAGIVDAINNIADTGNVYGFIPWAAAQDVHLDFFKVSLAGYTQAFRGFTVSCTSIAKSGTVTGDATSNGTSTFTFVVRGFHAIEGNGEDSETDFLGVVISVMDELDQTNLTRFPRDKSQLVYGPDMIGNVLCHVAEITLNNIREESAC